eukprot:ANDGO_05237.mRNA.1 DEAD-box ATP-dependent RNA helicase 21
MPPKRKRDPSYSDHDDQEIEQLLRQRSQHRISLPISVEGLVDERRKRQNDIFSFLKSPESAIDRATASATASSRLSTTLDHAMDANDASVISKEELDILRGAYLGDERQNLSASSSQDRTNRVRFGWDPADDTMQTGLNLSAFLRSTVRPALSHDPLLDDASDMGVSCWDKSLARMRDRDWRILREELNLTVKGLQVPPLCRSWSEMPVSDRIIAAVTSEFKYDVPTPIQMQAIPILASQKDLIGIAETGTGKTLAYIIPMVSQILQRRNQSNLEKFSALILAPTRELVLQIEQEANRLCSRFGIICLSVLGGVDIQSQSIALQHGCQVVVATPGRLLECYQSRILTFECCSFVVVDEVDRMFDMDMEAQLTSILDSLKHSTIGSDMSSQVMSMFSATMPPNIEKLATSFMKDAIMVSVGQIGTAAETIRQRVEFVKTESEKMEKLIRILETSPPPVVVFANQRKTVDVLSRDLDRRGFSVCTLHSGKSQEQRQKAIDDIKNGKSHVLVTTSVGGRGLDIPGITHVINYDMPMRIDEYVQRIGRTGRGGSQGSATSFVMPSDSAILFDLKQMLLRTNNPIPQQLRLHSATVPRGQKSIRD